MFDLNQQPIVLQDIVPDVLGFLEVLQDMSSFNPSSRVSASVALNRLKKLRSQTPSQALSQIRQVELSGYCLIPRSFCRTLFEIISAGQLWLACRFAWASFRKLSVVPLLVHVSSFLNSSRFRVGSKKTD